MRRTTTLTKSSSAQALDKRFNDSKLNKTAGDSNSGSKPRYLDTITKVIIKTESVIAQ